MVKLLFLILFFQKPCFQTVTRSGEAVSFATVKKKNQIEGLFTDENGHFCFENLKKGDTLQFSAVGFQAKEKSFEELMLDSKVFLNSYIHELEEIVVKTRKLNLTKAGHLKSEFWGYSHSFSPNSMGIVAQFIENEKDIVNGIVKNIKLPVDNHGINFKLRFRFFKNGTKNFPSSQDIIFENIVVDTGKEAKSVQIDVEKYTIPFEKDGIWVTIECLGKYDANNAFLPSKIGQFGKVKYNNKNPTKVASFDYLSPTYKFLKAKPKIIPYHKSYRGAWEPAWYNAKLAMALGLEIIH